LLIVLFCGKEKETNSIYIMNRSKRIKIRDV